MNTTPCIPRAVGAACDVIDTDTRDTGDAEDVEGEAVGGRPAADVADFAGLAAATGPEPAGGPTHTGSSPARTEAVEASAVGGAVLTPPPAPTVSAATADPAAGHNTWGRRATGIGGTAATCLATSCTATGVPADAGGGPAAARAGIAIAGSTPATSDHATSAATRGTNTRRRP